jgi:ATP-dependent DNA helicase RecG
MIENFLKLEEGKTLEFKENASSLEPIIRTVIAFANTAGGNIIIGIRNKTKEVIGIKNVLENEERIANKIYDSIEPAIFPDLTITSWRKKELIIIQVPHSIGPFFLKSKKMIQSTYVRFGSTNRIADKNTIEELLRLRENITYDELPSIFSNKTDLDIDSMNDFFIRIKKKYTIDKCISLKLLRKQNTKIFPTNGALLLFCKNREKFFPNSIIRCARFAGIDKVEIIDQYDFNMDLTKVIDEILKFIRRNTYLRSEIKEIQRKDIPEYPIVVIREAITNAILHSDYTVLGSNIQIAIFDNRIEITNPGALPYGLTLTEALSGMSLLRNRVIGKIFKELNIIEQWGSGFSRIFKNCTKLGYKKPKIEELGHFFRITIYNEKTSENLLAFKKPWMKNVFDYINKEKFISIKQTAKLLKITDKTARTRLKEMINDGILQEIGTSKYDPKKKYVLTTRFSK